MSELVLPVRATGQSSQRFSQVRTTSPRFALLAGLCAALLLAFSHRAQAAAYTPPIEFFHGTSVIAVGEAASAMLRPATEELFNGAQILITWTGSGETTSLDTTYYLYYYAFANFTGVTPGIFDVFATADWSARAENIGLPASSCISTASAPQSITVVTVTNVTASAYHVAEGSGPVTLTAQMTPINAPEKVFWDFAPSEGGGGFSTNQGLTTLLYHGAGWSSNRVVARCGTTSTEVLIHIYRVTGITASPQPAVAGEPITLTAITEPANCPLPITWNISTNTGATITNAFGPGTHTVIASLGAGTITQTLDVVSVGVKEILYEWPANSDNWLPWSGLATGFPPLPATAAVAVGSSFNLKAMPEPEGAEFPAGWPVWSGAASGSGPIATATFTAVSTNLSDYQSVTATSGTSSRTEQAVVFGIDSILVATNHVAIGTNTLTLTPQMTPASGGEHLVVWDCTNATLTLGSGAGVEFPCDQSGSFTVTAACGSSSASTNLFVYRVTGVVVPHLHAVGVNVIASATIEPSGCPLPLRWSANSTVSLPFTTQTFIFSPVPKGNHILTAHLGNSEVSTNFWVIGVSNFYYKDPQSGSWEPANTANYELINSSLEVAVIRDPDTSPDWPPGYPQWFLDNTTSASFVGQQVIQRPFASLSLSLGDNKWTRAICGTNWNGFATTVFKMEIKAYPFEDWLLRGSDPSQFGLCELVVISNNVSPAGLTVSDVGALWSPTTNGYFGTGSGVDSWDGMTAVVEDVSAPETIPFAVYRRGNVIASKSIEFIEPEGVTYTPVYTSRFYTNSTGGIEELLPGPQKASNSWPMSRNFEVFITPAHVSFRRLQFMEEAAQVITDGIVDQALFRDGWGWKPIGKPVPFRGGPVNVDLFGEGIHAIDFEPDPSPIALVYGFNLGTQSATVKLAYKVPLISGEHRVGYFPSLIFSGSYFGTGFRVISFDWANYTSTGNYYDRLPFISSP
jgi:hypothetical protein